MHLQFILGSSGAGKSFYCYKKIIDESIKNPDTNYLVIVPEQFTLQTQRDLVTMHPRKGIMNIDVLSFMRLAYRVFEETGVKPKLVLEDSGKSMIIKKVLLEKSKDLVQYGANVRKQGFIDEMKSVISEMYQYSVEPEQLEQLSSDDSVSPLLTSKIKDIITVYRGFREFLSRKYITTEEVLDILSEELEKSVMMKNAVLCLDGFTGFTPSQYKLLSKLLKCSQKVYATVTMDAAVVFKVQKEHQLFYMSQKMMDKLEELANDVDCKVEEPVVLGEKSTILPRFDRSPALASLERNLFRYPSERYEEEQDDIRIFSEKNPTDEVISAICEIQHFVRDEGWRYRDIAIVTGDIETYGAICRRELEEAGIPYFVDEKKQVMSNPLIELLRSLMQLAEQDYTYEAVFRYLRCGYGVLTPEETDVLENYVIAFAKRGKASWKQKWNRTYKTEYKLDTEYINQLRERVIEALNPVIDVLSDEKTDVRSRITALYEYMQRYDIEEKIKTAVTQLQDNPLLISEYEQIFSLVIQIFDRTVELLGEEQLTAREFREIIETGFSEIKVGLVPPGTDRIVVGDIERTRLEGIKGLFFIGVNDGIIPRANPGGGILNDNDRQTFLDCGVELSPTKRQQAYTTEFYLYLKLTKPSEKLYMFYSRLDSEGKKIRPSYLISRVRQLYSHINLSENNRFDRILGTDGGTSSLITGLRDNIYNETFSDEIAGLIALFIHESENTQINRSDLLEALFYRTGPQKLDDELARKVFGDVLMGSVSRMEQYASCAFAHFLEYGLRLEERTEYKISMPDLGSLFHSALEIFSNKIRENGYTWRNINEEKIDEFGSEALEEAADDFGNGIMNDTSRNSHYLYRVEKILNKTIHTLTEQLIKGDFEPSEYERSFFYNEGLLNLKGRIDRIDTYVNNDSTFVRIIDYKSGNKSFNMCELYYGLQIQLAVYMNAAMRICGKDTNIVPAGMFYYSLKNPIVDKLSDVEAAVRKELTMSGLVNSDNSVIAGMDRTFMCANGGLMPETKSECIPVQTDKDGNIGRYSSVCTKSQFDVILQFTEKKLAEYSKEIRSGEVSRNPYSLGNVTACDYCSYRDACCFDSRVDGDCIRQLKKMNTDDAYKAISEEI